MRSAMFACVKKLYLTPVRRFAMMMMMFRHGYAVEAAEWSIVA
jgi:hypothetical protein